MTGSNYNPALIQAAYAYGKQYGKSAMPNMAFDYWYTQNELPLELLDQYAEEALHRIAEANLSIAKRDAAIAGVLGFKQDAAINAMLGIKVTLTDWFKCKDTYVPKIKTNYQYYAFPDEPAKQRTDHLDALAHLHPNEIKKVNLGDKSHRITKVRR